MATNLASKNFAIPTILNVDGAGDGLQRPFDITIFSSGNCSIAAGTINNVVPSNMFTNFTFNTAAINYCKVAATSTAGGQISSASISINTTPPTAPAVLQGGPPTSIDLLFGIISGSAFRTIGDSNFTVNVVESHKIPKTVSVGELPYDIYYTWQIITS